MSIGFTMVHGSKTLFESIGLVGNDREIFLFAGAPGPEALDGAAEIMEKATSHRLKTRGDSYILQYGPVLGERHYLEQLAQFLSAEYGDSVSDRHLIATAGATNGLSMILQMLYMKERPVIFIEDLSYHLAFGMLEAFTDQPLVPIKLAKDGVDTAQFDRELERRKPLDASKRKFPWALFYCIPTFHNPTGRVYSPEVSKALVKMARRHNVLIVCDDVYNIFYYDVPISPLRLAAYDCRDDPDYTGHVISNGSFSKLLGPGLRVGWIEGPAWFSQLWRDHAVLISGGAVNNYTAGIIGSALEMGLVSSFVAKWRQVYKERKVAILETLRSRLPSGSQVEDCTGGYFVWIQLPAGYDANMILKAVERKHHILAVPGTKFTIIQDEEIARRCIRLSISYYEKQILRDATEKLCDIIDEHLQ